MKKVLALTLAILCALPLWAAATEETTVGDVNTDGVINSLDAATVLKHDARLLVIEDETLADVNTDGSVNSLDAAFILRYDAGLDTEGSALPDDGDGVQLSTEGSALSHADYIAIDDIYTTSLDERGLFRFDSVDDLQRFRAKYGENGFDYGYDEVPSFNSVTESYDEAFFEEYCLILKYIQCAGSDRYAAYDLRWFERKKELVLYYGHVDYTIFGTDDMNGFFVTVPVLKSEIEGCLKYSAEYRRPIEIYAPDESFNSFIVKEVLFDGTEEGIAAVLEKEGCIPDGSVMKGFDVRSNIAYVDMNETFAEGVSAGTMTEYFYVGCLVNTLLDYSPYCYYYGSYDKVMITVNGQPMVTEHVGEWTEPLGYYTGIGVLEGLLFISNGEELASNDEINTAMMFMRDFVTALQTGNVDTCNAMATEKYLDMAEIYRIDESYIADGPIEFLPPEEYATDFTEYTLPSAYRFRYYDNQDAAIRTGDERHVLFCFEFWKTDEHIAPSTFVFDLVFEENGRILVNNFGEEKD